MIKKAKQGRTRDFGRFWYVSPLALRILAVNVGALLVLVVGLLYTGQYERGLIEADTKALAVEGRLIARMIAESGTREALDAGPQMAEDLARQTARALQLGEDTRVIVFGKTGRLMVDSHQFSGPGGAVEVVPLDPPFHGWDIGGRGAFVLERALDTLPFRLKLPLFPASLARGAQDYPGIMAALSGEAGQGAWRDQDGRILLAAATPVQDLKNVIGAVLVLRGDKGITAAVRGVQFAVLKSFAAALLVTIMLTLYLAETIVHPIVRLAAATQKVRQSLALKDEVPDLSWRADEIGALSAAFREMTQSLSDRMDAISRFSADVAHEIKNPLASVKSAVETLARVQDPAQQKRLLSVIHDDVDRLNRLITDISAASRVDSDLARAPRGTFDLAPLLRRVAEEERAGAEEGRAIFLALEEGRRLPVTGNDTQLAQVVRNLVDNALSFAPPGGVVALSALADTDRVVLHVDNDGPAIPEDKLEAVFERFYTERPKTEKFGLHSGLGLSICRQIVRTHGGEIMARNMQDEQGAHKGVRFTVILPAGAGTK